jgi:ABC-type branched-subunit amino acid transport system substrate-binding protein
MINETGGINGRKINFIQYDDAFSPPKTVEQVRKLVEGDEVLLMFYMMGTAPSSAVQKYLNEKHVPQLFVASGVGRFTDPVNFPWSMGFNISYSTEANIYAKYILSNYPDAKIGILFQNDDLGREYVASLKSGLGDKAAKMIVATEPYETTDPTVDSQILKLRAADANLLYDITGPKAAGQTIKKLAEIGWKPVHILDSSAATVWAVVQSAGLENSRGVISVGYAKDPLDPTWKDDSGMKNFVSFMEKYYPDGDKTSGFQVQGYNAAQLMVEVLKRCGDNLTRENIMKQATSLTGVKLDLALPGVSINTSPTDYRVNKQVQMIKFSGERWEPFGPVIGASSN